MRVFESWLLGGGGRGLALYSPSISLIMPMTHLHTGRAKAPEGGVVAPGEPWSGRGSGSLSKLLGDHTQMESIERQKREGIALKTALCQPRRRPRRRDTRASFLLCTFMGCFERRLLLEVRMWENGDEPDWKSLCWSLGQ